MLIFDPSANGPGTPFSIIEAGALPSGLFGWGVFNITNTPVAAVTSGGVLQSPARYTTEVSQASYTENSVNPANDPRVWVPPSATDEMPDPNYTGSEVSNALQVAAYNMTPGMSQSFISGAQNNSGPLGIWAKPGFFVSTRFQSLFVSGNYGRDWYAQGVFPRYSSITGWDGEHIYQALFTKQNLVVLQTTPLALGWSVIAQIPLSTFVAPSGYYAVGFVYPVGGGAVLMVEGYNTSHAVSSLAFYYLNGASAPAAYDTSEIASLNPSDFNIGFFSSYTGTAIFFYSAASGLIKKACLFGAGGLVDITATAPSTPWAPQGMPPLASGYRLPIPINTGAQLYPTANLLSPTATSPI